MLIRFVAGLLISYFSDDPPHVHVLFPYCPASVSGTVASWHPNCSRMGGGRHATFRVAGVAHATGRDRPNS